MGVTTNIMRRELGAYFNTPIGYVFMIAFLLVSSYFFVDRLFLYGVAEMRMFFNLIPWFFLLLVPGITMRLWSEERKLGTIELLMTMPVKTWQAVMGKFLGALIFLVMTLALTLPLPLILVYLSPAGSPGPDWGQIVGGYLGCIMLGMVYLAAGSFASSVTKDQIIAFVIGIFINLVLLLISWPDMIQAIRDYSAPLATHVQRFGVWHHFESISRGVLDTRDIIYALSMTGMFLFMNILVIERKR